MRRLRDIAMRAPQIGNAQLIQKNCYVYSNQSDILFIIPADKILGWNGNAITIRLGAYDLTYSNTGQEIGIVTVSTIR